MEMIPLRLTDVECMPLYKGNVKLSFKSTWVETGMFSIAICFFVEHDFICAN